MLALNKQAVPSMNIIFDLNGALFNTLQDAHGKNTQAIKLTHHIHIMRLLHDCLTHGNRLFAVSQWSQSLYEFMSDVPHIKQILNLFDDIVLLETVGYASTDSRVFEHLITKHRLDPRRCIVVNDSPLHLDAARQVGAARNIICTTVNVTKVRQELEHHGAL